MLSTDYRNIRHCILWSIGSVFNHLWPASLQRTGVNKFKGTINLKEPPPPIFDSGWNLYSGLIKSYVM
jgi:hypothetical protein